MDIWNDYECEEQMDIFDFLGEETKVSITKPIKMIELFSGYGSQSLAMEYLGIPFEHHFVCEFDKYACASYSKLHRFNVEPLDIRNCTGSMLNVKDTDKYMYFMWYSFPCTDLSVSGSMKGMSKNSGTRSGLLWEVERLLNEMKDDELPQLLLMENVSQIHGVTAIHDFKQWIYALEELGYKSFWSDLNAKDFGVPQNRERTFMLSFLTKEFGKDIVYRFPKPFPLTKCIEDILEDEVDERYYVETPDVQKMIDELVEREHLDE